MHSQAMGSMLRNEFDPPQMFELENMKEKDMNEEIDILTNHTYEEINDIASHILEEMYNQR